MPATAPEGINAGIRIPALALLVGDDKKKEVNKVMSSQAIQNQTQSILPRNVDRAVEMLIALTQDLLHITHEEHGSLVTLDHMRFAYAQKEKESLSLRYAQASEEFRGRLGAFRMADRALIADLNALQSDLQNITESNNRLIDDIMRRTQATTQSSLFIAQEMGQHAPIGTRGASLASNSNYHSRAATPEKRSSIA